MVIMVLQPSTNSTHNSLLHYPRALRRSNTFRKISNQFRLDDHAFMLLGVRRSRRWLSTMKRSSGSPASRDRQRRRTRCRCAERKELTDG
jgi:hypothetical protein